MLSSTGIHTKNMGYERFLSHFKEFPGTVLIPFLLDPDPYRFCPDSYQSSPWIRIRNEVFHILIWIRIKMIRIRHTACRMDFRSQEPELAEMGPALQHSVLICF